MATDRYYSSQNLFAIVLWGLTLNVAYIHRGIQVGYPHMCDEMNEGANRIQVVNFESYVSLATHLHVWSSHCA